MFGDYISSKFEIEITNRNGRIEAFTPIFPECYGFGVSEQEAIEDLADSISMYISELVKDSVKDFIKQSSSRSVSKVKEIKKEDDDKAKLKPDPKKDKNKFIFSPQFSTDYSRITKLFKDSNKKPIMKHGLLSIMGLKSMNMPLNGKNEFNISQNDIEVGNEFGLDSLGFVDEISSSSMLDDLPAMFAELRGMKNRAGFTDFKEPESFLLGIPLSFN